MVDNGGESDAQFTNYRVKTWIGRERIALCNLAFIGFGVKSAGSH
jgi:hypothetical protein